MSTDDYARFVWASFGPQTAFGQAPKSVPHIETLGAFYGPGTLFRPFREGHNFWHFGTLCLGGGADVGSYSVLFSNGWSLVAAVDKCLSGDDMGSLDLVLSRPAVQ